MRMGRQLLPFEQAWRWTADFAERGARALAFDRPVPYVARVVLLAAVYFVAAKLAFLAAIPPGVAGGTRSGYALLLAWARGPLPAWTPRKIAEGSLLVFLLSGVMCSIFGAGLAPYIPSLPLTFAILPFIIWGAFRFRQREVATVNALVCAMAVWFTLEGSGPFVQGSLNESLLLLLAFMCTVVTTGLVLNAVVDDRRRAVETTQRILRNLREQTLRDPLTSLYNRRFLEDYLERELIRAKRERASLALIMMDLDRFKQINDSAGHQAGDQVLVEVGALLKRHVRGSDIACRYGGEEFALVLPKTTLESACRRSAEI